MRLIALELILIAAAYIGYYYRSEPFVSRSCNYYGCSYSYDSYIALRTPLDYTYYRNPWLLESRRMDVGYRYRYWY